MLSTNVTSGGDFVGRRDELASLLHAFAGAREGHTSFVYVEGEAGIGKSRLVREMLRRVGNGATIVSGNCVEQIRTPYLPFEDVFSRFARRMPSSTPAARRPHTEEKARFFRAFGELLRRESSRKPLVLIVEDAQWADDATIELLRYLVTAISDARLLIVMTARPIERFAQAELAALHSAIARRHVAIAVRPLSSTDVKILVAHRCGAHSSYLSPETVVRIEALAEGNPLFAEELTRIAVVSGTLSFGSTMPLSIAAMLSERLRGFSESERNVLVRTAIVGDRFTPELVARIADVDIDDVLSTLQRAAEREIVVERPTGDGYRFCHALIRRALADHLVFELAAPLHVRIAESIERAGEAETRVSELAYHYAAARVPERARYYNERAGEAAWAMHAYRDGIRFFTEALRWEYPPGPERALVYERIGSLLYIEGVGEEPARWFERSRDEHERLGNAIGRAQALLLIADQCWVDARTSQSIRAAAEAASNLERLGHASLTSRAILTVARFAITLGNADQASAQLRRAARLRAAFDSETRATFYEVRAETRAAVGDTARALSDCRLASRFAARTGESELIAQVENNVALVAADLGELDLACEHHRVALNEARRTGLMWRVAYCALNYAQTLMTLGKYAGAREQLIAALACGVTTATFTTRAAAIGIPLALALRDADLLGACAHESALEFADRSQELQRIASVYGAFAELRASQGRLDEARQLLARALAAMPHTHRCWQFWPRVGQWGRAEDVAMARTVLAGSQGRPRLLRTHLVLLAALSHREVDPERARREARVAMRLFDAMKMARLSAFACELSGDREAASERYRAIGVVRDVERPSNLTARQAEIADLVAQGATNREIAARLFISEHTVEHHLSALFARLGLKSRAQLTAHVVGQRRQ